jgi:hypothetical protein
LRLRRNEQRRTSVGRGRHRASLDTSSERVALIDRLHCLSISQRLNHFPLSTAEQLSIVRHKEHRATFPHSPHPFLPPSASLLSLYPPTCSIAGTFVRHRRGLLPVSFRPTGVNSSCGWRAQRRLRSGGAWNLTGVPQDWSPHGVFLGCPVLGPGEHGTPPFSVAAPRSTVIYETRKSEMITKQQAVTGDAAQNLWAISESSEI